MNLVRQALRTRQTKSRAKARRLSRQHTRKFAMPSERITINLVAACALNTTARPIFNSQIDKNRQCALLPHASSRRWLPRAQTVAQLGQVADRDVGILVVDPEFVGAVQPGGLHAGVQGAQHV